MLFVMLRFVLLACVLWVSMPVTAQELEPAVEAEVELEVTPPTEVVDVPDVPEPVEEPVDANTAEAQMRFELGSSLYSRGRFAQALVEFRRSYELSGELRLLHNMYLCERDAGNTSEAAEHLRHYLDGEGVENRQLLESRLAILDEQAAAEAARARADLAEQATEQAPEPSQSRALPITFFALGGIALASAGGLALHVRALNSRLNDSCFSRALCPEHLNSETLRRRAIAVDSLWASGLALVVSGVLMWVLMPGAEDDSEPALAVSCGTQTCTVEGHF